MALGTDFVKELEYYRKRCLELEKKSENDEIRYYMLEAELENLKKKNEELEGKIAKIQNVVSVENDEDKIVDLMIENKVLECEKQKAETEVSSWKEKVNKLVSRVCELESVMKEMHEKGEHDINRLAPSTPGVIKSRVFVNAKRKKASNIVTSEDEIDNSSNDEDMNELKILYSSTKNAKRKRAANIITSDDESIDDSAPICIFKRQHNSSFKMEDDANKRDKTDSDLNKTVCLHGNISSDDEEDEVSESEGESLGGFIVDSSESACESGDSCDEFENVSSDYKETLDKIGRQKVSNLKWDLEGEMLADFGKDPELCMRAVCALYRQQTADEKASKEAIHHNGRGFSQPDAFRASKLAEFLTDGDSAGDLNKTVEELKQYDSKGIKLCMKLAAKYSKQLFAIYQKKEDKYFMPQ